MLKKYHLLLALLLLPQVIHSQINTEILKRHSDKTGISQFISTQFNIVKGNSDYLAYSINYRTDFITKKTTNFRTIGYY